MTQAAKNKSRATTDPTADCPSVTEYELRRRERMAAPAPAAKPTKKAAA